MQELYIDDDTALRRYLEMIDSEPVLALDTEFVREKTYFPRLCLVQLASPTSIACIDCLAEMDLKSLLNRLLRDDCAWIVHSSRQDLEVIYQHTAGLPQRLIDTQIAAGLVGFPPQIGLQDLLVELLGVRLDKHHTRTDWGVRPLPDAALAYARDDVRSLHSLWSTLAARLDALGRRSWLEQDCALLLKQAPVASPELIWMRLKGLRALDAESQGQALALVAWREQRARSRDRPRRWVLADDQLIAIARARPASVDELRSLPGLPARLIHNAGAEMLEALAAATTDAARQQIEQLKTEAAPDKRRLRGAQARVRSLATKLGIHPEVLATKQEITELLLGRQPVRIAASWRGLQLTDLAGDES